MELKATTFSLFCCCFILSASALPFGFTKGSTKGSTEARDSHGKSALTKTIQQFKTETVCPGALLLLPNCANSAVLTFTMRLDQTITKVPFQDKISAFCLMCSRKSRDSHQNNRDLRTDGMQTILSTYQ